MDSDIRDGECVRGRGSAGPDTERPGTVPFVSHRPGAYGRLCVGVLSDIRLAVPCYAGGGGAGGPLRQSQHGLGLTSAD